MNRYVVAVAAVLLLTSCGGKGSTSTSPTGGSQGDAAGETRQTSKVARKYLGAVPKEAATVLSIDFPQPVWTFMTEWSMLTGPTTKKYQKAMSAELRDFVEERLGLDVSKIQAVVAFGDLRNLKKPGLAVMVGPVGGTLRGDVATHEGARELLLEKGDSEDLIASKRGDVVVIGSRGAVRATHKRLQGGAEPAGLAKKLLHDHDGAYLAMSVETESFNQFMALAGVPVFDDVTVAVHGSRASVLVHGTPDALRTYQTMFDKLTTEAMAKLADARAEATKEGSDTAEGIGAIYAYHTGAGYIAALRPTLSGNSLAVSVDFEASSGMMSVGVVGVLAAVAIPAFMKYIKKSKTAEAKQLIRTMHDGARARHIGGKGTYPAQSVGPTPAMGICCASGGKCTPDAKQWEHPTWKALGFSIDDPHYYSYEYKYTPAKGKSQAQFEALAYGDLDCDGIYSTFSMTGAAPSANSMRPSILSEDELE